MRTLRLALVAVAIAGRILVSGRVDSTAVAARSPAVNVLLISIDTLRADHLGAYGYAAAQTPTIDALARRGLRFTHASTVTPADAPGAHLAPHRHVSRLGTASRQRRLLRVRRSDHAGRGAAGARFPDRRVRRAFVLDARWGIAQGFDRYFDDFDLSKYEGRGLDAVQRPGSDVVDQAVAWLDEDRDRPFFAWVHMYDPHTPYDAPEPFRSRFPANMVGAYDAEIASADSQVARLLARLDASNRLDSTLVVIVGDHGESLGEHQEQTHGFFIYDATIRIPLVIAGPGVPARQVDDVVRIVDVMPTILDEVGAAAPRAVQGVSLRPLGDGRRLDLLAVAETYYPRYHYGWSDLQAIADGRYKLVAAPRRELYDLRDDPGETLNVAASNAARADALERGLRDMLGRLASREPQKAPRPMDPEQKNASARSGTSAGRSARGILRTSPEVIPRTTIRLYNVLHRAAQDSVEGRLDEAIAKVHDALAEDPNIVEGHTMLGNLYSKAKRYDDAVRAYQAALHLDPDHQGAAFSLALTYKQMGRLADAEMGFARAQELDPRSGKNDWQLADLAMQRGDHAKASAVLEMTLRDKKWTGRLSGETGRSADRGEEVRRGRTQPEAGHRGEAGRGHGALRERNLAMAEYQIELRRKNPSYRASFNLAKLLAADRRPAEAVTPIPQRGHRQPGVSAPAICTSPRRCSTPEIWPRPRSLRARGWRRAPIGKRRRSATMFSLTCT